MTCDIVIKSYPADYEWLALCLRSIEKFCTGFRQIILIAPDNSSPWPTWPFNLVVEPELEPGYLGQQARKLYADTHTDADYLLFIDSDNIVARPFSPHDFMQGDKVKWLMTPWNEMPQDAINAWFPVMHNFAGVAPDYEFMRQFPFLVPRWLFPELRGFCVGKHGQTLHHYIMSQANRAFSEFNVMGHYLWNHHRDEVQWIDTTKDEFTQGYVRQFYSYGGITPEIRAEIERLLA